MLIRLYDGFVDDHEVKLLVEQYSKEFAKVKDITFSSHLYEISNELELIIKLKYDIKASGEFCNARAVYIIDNMAELNINDT